MPPDRWIIIPNWARFQHYADRAPLWIKVYLELNDRDDWRRLSLAQRGLVVSLWCEYGAANGLIRTSDVPGRIAQKVLGSTWDLLQREGWVELSASRPEPLRASAARARARTRARAETEEEIEPLTPQSGELDLGQTTPKNSRAHGTNPRALGTNPRQAAKPTALQRAEAFVKNAGVQYEPSSFEEELARFDLDPDEYQQVHDFYDHLRPAALAAAQTNGATPQEDELPWEGEEPPVVVE